MNARSRSVARNVTLAALVAAGSIACGQRGPLELPEKARPVQRIEVPQPPPPADAPAPEKQDDEQKNER
jgi:predicted small lipoprotein YifL